MEVLRMDKGRLKKRITNMFRTSLASTCSLTSRNLSDSVQEPVFVSSRHHDFHHLDSCSSSVNHRPPPLSPHLSLDFTSNRPTKPDSTKKKETRVFEFPPVSPLTSSSDHCMEKKEEERKGGEIVTGVEKKEKKTRKKLLSNSYGFTSSSSGGSDGGGILFSSDEERRRREKSSREIEEESETLFSSKSFSSDSSEFYYSSSRNHKRTSRRHRPRSKRYSELGDGYRPLVTISSPAPMKKEKGKGKEEEVVVGNKGHGLAVVKQSSDPYADFRSSVLEMMMENQIVGVKELDQLLNSYLSLNSPSHHPIILRVFSDVWEALFEN